MRHWPSDRTALLDNSARPSGALVYAARDGNLTEEQFQRLKEELEAGFAGARGAGRPMLLEGGLDWKQLSLSPKDMDFVEAKNAAAREIALALGVPPMLLGIPGDNTYSNYQEATRSFWRQTVLPLVVRTAKAMSMWLSPAWGGALELRPDLDAIEALSVERDQLWARLEKASFLTQDEKRAAAGYGPNAAAGARTEAVKFNPNHDDLGRFTTADGAVAPGGGGTQEANLGRLIGRLLGGKPKAPKPPKPSEHPLQDILKPGGKEIGVKVGGAGSDVRTVGKEEFEGLRGRLLEGAREVPSPNAYEGRWYERPDGTRIGVRQSNKFGTTIDVIEGGKSGFDNGYRIHRK